MKSERSGCRGGVFRAGSVLAALLCGGFSLSGCNAGLFGLIAVLAIDDDDDGGPGTDPGADTTIEFLGTEGARSNPSRVLLGVKLANGRSAKATLSVEAGPSSTELAPATLLPPFPGTPGDPGSGTITELDTSPGGVSHVLVWNASADTGATGQTSAVLRLATGDKHFVERTVTVGNDPPEILEASFDPLETGDVRIQVRLADTGPDPTDVAVQVAAVDEELEYLPATTTGRTTDLETSDSDTGVPHEFVWNARLDRGDVGPFVSIRLTPRDRVEGNPGKTGAPVAEELCLGNSPPVVAVLQEELLRDEDPRRGLAVPFVVADGEGDPVDVIVQWSPAGEEFPELPSSITGDASAREALLGDPEARRSLRIVSLRAEPIRGVVEEPASGVSLEEDAVLATWLRRDTDEGGLVGIGGHATGGVPPGPRLVGRHARLLRSGGSVTELQVAGYEPEEGILRFAAAPNPPAVQGDLIEVDLGGELEFATDAEGLRHRVIWDIASDVPGGGSVRVRLTPYDRPGSPPGAEVPPGCEFGGRRGPSSETTSPRALRSPFHARSPSFWPLAEVDDPVDVASGDIDDDGRLDIVCAARFSRSILVLRQTAAGAFQTLRLQDARLGEPTAVVSGDLDGDGDDDVAVSGESFVEPAIPEYEIPERDFPAHILILFSDEGDLIDNRLLLVASPRAFEPADLVAVDFDGDGELDLAAANADPAGSPAHVFYRGAGARPGLCDAAVNGYVPCAVGEAGTAVIRTVAAGDINGDGRPELLAAGVGGFLVFRNTGSGISSSDPTAVLVDGADVVAAEVFDVDGDGLPDLVGVDAVTSQAIVARQVDPSTFEVMDSTPLDEVEAPRALATADVNGNDLADLVLVGGDAARGGSIYPALATPSGYLAADEVDVPSGVGGDTAVPRAVAVGDADGDGRGDWITLEGPVAGGKQTTLPDGPSRVGIYGQDGPGWYSEEPRALAEDTITDPPSAVAVTDWDGDGRNDVAVATRVGNGVVIVVRKATGETVELVEFTAGGDAAGPVALVAADIDGDGWADLATANVDSDNVALIYQNAGGSTVPRVEILADGGLEGPQSVALADIDGDGRLDVVTAGRFSDNVLWFAQNDDGTFAPAATVSPQGGPLAGPIGLVAEDLDRDGRVDLAAVGHASGNVVIFHQLAARGSFAQGMAVTLPEQAPVAAVAADFTGDGRVDIAVANLGSVPLTVLSQLPAGSFTPLPLGEVLKKALEGTVATALATGDLDHNGVADVVLADALAGDPALHVVLFDASGDLRDASHSTLRSPIADAPVSVAVADLDDDGEPDIVSANRASSNVTVTRGGR